MLEQALNSDSTNIELRYLRLTIQTNVPAFLGYNNNINSDKKYLLDSLMALGDIQLKNSIIEFLTNSDNTTTTEKQMVWKIKNS